MNLSNKMKKLLAFALLGADVVPTLAQAIDRVILKMGEKRAQACTECPACEEDAAKDATEELAEEIPAMAEVVPAEQEVLPDTDPDDEDSEEDGEEDLLEEGRFGKTTGLRFFDAVAYPERYVELLAREANGEVQIVTRYRYGFSARVGEAEEEVREYYSAIKNKLLSYKGVKSRVSWGGEAFNKGRVSVAKLNVKAKTIYLYLAMDPAFVASLEDGKYRIDDLSSKKKYESVPTLFKIKGPRKFKYALELIELLCAQQLQLPLLKKFKEVDYTGAAQTLSEQLKSGDVKMMVCGVEIDGN